MAVVHRWFWPVVAGSLTSWIVVWLSPPPDGPFRFIWLICVVTSGWPAAYLVRALLTPGGED